MYPKYRGLSVVENPSTSSPGLAFLAATIARHPGDAWKEYWKALKRNDVRVVADWTSAYETEFTGGGGSGTRPIVVSYASSPPADVVYSDGKKKRPTIAAVTKDCFRQYEFAGVLHNAKHPNAATQLVEFLASATFQADMPLNMFVYPTRANVPLPKVFTDFAAVVEHPITIDYREIDKQRTAWIRDWTTLEIG